jgi:hypothetical protein
MAPPAAAVICFMNFCCRSLEAKMPGTFVSDDETQFVHPDLGEIS